MARKEKKPKPTGGVAPWLITFSDMMTLMLTFFVLLVSMSVIDERRRLIVLGSIIGTFGVGKDSYDVLSTKDTRRTVEPGPFEMEDINDLEPLKEMVWEDVSEDLAFAENKFVQILSINSDVLFEPGEAELTEQGKKLLERALPVLLQIDYPLLLAGHTSRLRDEMGIEYKVEEREKVMDDSWRLSLYRTLSVYKFLIDNRMDPNMLRVEAFGRHHPRYTDLTAEGRSMNRRVDVILDKRNTEWLDKLGPERKDERIKEFIYKDFVFELEQNSSTESEEAP
jgi:chemotaxis protein MotB